MLIRQIKFAAVLKQQIIESLFPEFADKRGADKAVMAGDEDFGGGVHGLCLRSEFLRHFSNRLLMALATPISKNNIWDEKQVFFVRFFAIISRNPGDMLHSFQKHP